MKVQGLIFSNPVIECGIQKSWTKRLGKAFRRAKGIQIHGVNEPDIKNRRYCTNLIQVLQLNSTYTLKMELRESAIIVNTKITVRSSKVNQISYQLEILSMKGYFVYENFEKNAE